MSGAAVTLVWSFLFGDRSWDAPQVAIFDAVSRV